jgi:adenosylhomocysteine nucleosidase
VLCINGFALKGAASAAAGNKLSSSSKTRVAIVAALERELHPLVKNWNRTHHDHEGRSFTFFERADTVVICDGIGAQAARRAAEAVIALYNPSLLQSVGFAGALDANLHIGEIFTPSLVLDARDGSRIQLAGAEGALITFMSVAGAQQKAKLARAYEARAVDMEAAAVAAAARAHGIPFAAIKVISDEFNFEIPAMSAFIDAEGGFQTVNFTLFALLRPWLWPRLVALARNSQKASRALSAHLESFCNQLQPVAAVLSPTVLPTGGRK